MKTLIVNAKTCDGSGAPAYAGELPIDGDPLHDVRVLQDKALLKLIVKGGAAFKNALGAPA